MNIDNPDIIIAMSGASGFVGSSLSEKFKENGWQVIPLGRKEFDLSEEKLSKILQGVNIIINLAGAPVISRWTDDYKKKMRSSRIDLTRKLVNSCLLLEKNRPQIFLSASAIGCYSTEGSHTEDHCSLADDFLGQLTRSWEAEAFMAKKFAARTAVFRLGVVLGRNGGALAKMLVPFKLGLGGTIGDGRQPFSWIHIKDLINVFENAILDSAYEGIYNLTAPAPTTNLGLTKALGHALSRPTILPIPSFILQIIYGEGAQVLTSGQTVIPQRLLDQGFKFEFSTIQEAIADCLF